MIHSDEFEDEVGHCGEVEKLCGLLRLGRG